MNKMENYENKIQELKAEIEKLKKRKKYGIVWEEHPEELNLNAFPMLEEVKRKEIINDEKKPINLLIEGDNYHSLKSLLYTHKGKIDVIYIDPPYNTGNEFIYNDKIVDKEDLYRHSKWLSFMSKRLEIAKKLLAEEGIIFISIDDHEHAQLKMLCDEILNERNFVANFIWQKKKGGGNDSKFVATEHEYIICYVKDIKKQEKWFVEHDPTYLKRYKYEDEKGIYYWDTFKRTSGKQYYPVHCPDGTILEFEENGQKISWLRSKKRFEDDLKKGEVKIEKIGDKWGVYFKQYAPQGKKPRSLVTDLPTNSQGKADLEDLFKGENLFAYPKPKDLIKNLTKIKNKKNATILDFFAGSGTTGHAILELNKEDGGNRQFILCTNNENHICEKVTYPRVKKVINGYENSKGEKIEGLGGNLKYYRTIEVGDIKKQTDEDMEELIDKSVELLKIKHQCYQEIFVNKDFVIAENNKQTLGVLSNTDSAKEFIEEIAKSKGEKVIYIFSWSDESYKHMVNEIKTKIKTVEFKHLPEDIIRFYRSNKKGGARNE